MAKEFAILGSPQSIQSEVHDLQDGRVVAKVHPVPGIEFQRTFKGIDPNGKTAEEQAHDWITEQIS